MFDKGRQSCIEILLMDLVTYENIFHVNFDVISEDVVTFSEVCIHIKFWKYFIEKYSFLVTTFYLIQLLGMLGIIN